MANHTPQVGYNSGSVTQITIQGSLLYIVQMYTDPHGIKKLRPDYITPLVNSNTPEQKSQTNSYTTVQVSIPSGMFTASSVQVHFTMVSTLQIDFNITAERRANPIFISEIATITHKS
jgi:hypothetical protein